MNGVSLTPRFLKFGGEEETCGEVLRRRGEDSPTYLDRVGRLTATGQRLRKHQLRWRVVAIPAPQVLCFRAAGDGPREQRSEVVTGRPERQFTGRNRERLPIILFGGFPLFRRCLQRPERDIGLAASRWVEAGILDGLQVGCFRIRITVDALIHETEIVRQIRVVGRTFNSFSIDRDGGIVVARLSVDEREVVPRVGPLGSAFDRILERRTSDLVAAVLEVSNAQPVIGVCRRRIEPDRALKETDCGIVAFVENEGASSAKHSSRLEVGRTGL